MALLTTTLDCALIFQAWLGQQYEPSKVEPLGFVHCKQRGYCPANWGFWSATELCYPFDSQGPCQSGSLFRWNVVSQQAECGCQSAIIYQSSVKNDTLAGSSWRPYFWPISATCHEHHTNGGFFISFPITVHGISR